MRLERSRFVEDDLDAIADYIAQDNPTRAGDIYPGDRRANPHRWTESSALSTAT